jgi:predicted amidophosphoribosyltransferase
MTYSQICPDCNRKIALEYDEDDGTPAFCPFCGEELSEVEGDFVATPQDDQFDEDFENF